MNCTLTLYRYPAYFAPFSFLAMALFRIPLAMNKNITFWKLMGTGRNGAFTTRPDWRQWAILAVHKEGHPAIHPAKPVKALYGSMIYEWLHFFRCETWTVIMIPVSGHGKWDGKPVFELPAGGINAYEPVAVLTRATIRFSAIRPFWKSVKPVADALNNAEGLLLSLGIGELPLARQATLSFWGSAAKMEAFAYGSTAHREAMEKARKRHWFSEELFFRFRVTGHFGAIKGTDPLAGKL